MRETDSATVMSSYDAPARPLCLCAPGGVEMYIAFHHQYQIKRMPETGDRYHPARPSYEPGRACSGLGELIGQAVVHLDLDSTALDRRVRLRSTPSSQATSSLIAIELPSRAGSPKRPSSRRLYSTRVSGTTRGS